MNLLFRVESLIKGWGPWGVFAAGILEQVIAPIPSPIVPMGGGFFLIDKGVGLGEATRAVFLKVALPFSAGSALGASLVFLIAFWGGPFLINRFSRYLEIDWNDVERFKKRFFKGSPADELLIFLFMAIPGIPSVLVSAVSGAIRINLLKFYLFAFLGLLVRGMVLGFLGWWLGEAYQEVAAGVDRAESWILVLSGLLFLLLLFWGYRKREKWIKKE